MDARLTQDLNGAPRLRQKRQRFSLLILFIGIFVFVAAAGALYYALRPETLRIAVGPPDSDDQRLIQALAQSFARQRSAVRLAPIPTNGPTESLALLGADKADLAVTRGDLDMPADAQSVAILRKNVVVLWAPSGMPAKGSKKTPTPKINSLDHLPGHRIGVIGTTQVNVKLLRVILSESGIDANKVTVVQFAIHKISDMAHDASIDAYMSVGPLDSKITSEAIAATARERGEPKFLPIDVSEAIAQKHPLYESEEIPGSIFSSSPARPDDKVETVGVNHLVVARRELSETAVGGFTRQLFSVRQALARDGNSVEVLRGMQGEVDNIIRETLNCYDDGAIEQSDLSAFNLALEQFHRSVADRSAALEDIGADPPRLRSRQ